MVNFNLRLRNNTFSEWKDEYIDYKKLKKRLKKEKLRQQSKLAAFPQAVAVSTTTSGKLVCQVDDSALSLTASQASNVVDFEELLEQEYDKVQHAYDRHLDEFAQHFAILQNQFRSNAPSTTKQSLKNSLVELHRYLNHLRNFALLNYTGFVKIIKKHDKMFPHNRPLRPMHTARLSTLRFAEAIQCKALLNELEHKFADLFCDGNRSVAMATLMTKREEYMHWAHIYIGIKIGSCLILLMWVVWDSLIIPSLRIAREHHILDLALTRAFPVYRSIGCLLLLHWLVGVSVYVWRSARINYRYIFELDPRRTMPINQLFNDATNLTIVYLVNVLLYYKVVNGYFPEKILHRGYYPLTLVVYTVYFYVVRLWPMQRGLRQTLWEIIWSPLFAVSFFHTFVGDYLTSIVKVNQDLGWSICFFVTREFLLLDEIPALPGAGGVTHDEDKDKNASSMGTGMTGMIGMAQARAVPTLCQDNWYYVRVVVPLCCALPLWWRFLQNVRRIYDTKKWWPHIANAVKYALAQVVALFGVFHPFYATSGDPTLQIIWIGLFAGSSLYTWVWDVTMDWGLGRPQFGFLGDRQMFSRKWVYYVAMGADLVLRFAWTLTLVPPSSSSWLPQYFLPFTMVLELFRRTFWSFFRLENEHLRNTQGFRRVDFIPLHYDHDVGVDTDAQRDEEDLKPMAPRVFLMKISLIIAVVLGLSGAAIAVGK